MKGYDMATFFRNDWALVPVFEPKATYDTPLPSVTNSVFVLARALFESGQAPSFDAAVLSIIAGPSLPDFTSGDNTLLVPPVVVSGCRCGLRLEDDAAYCKCCEIDDAEFGDVDLGDSAACDFEYITNDEEI